MSAEPGGSPGKSEPNPSRRRGLWVLAACGLGLAVTGVMLFVPVVVASTPQTQQAKSTARVVPVRTARATTYDFPVVLAGIGTVVPQKTVTVQSRVSGQLVRVLFKEGEHVKAGQLLAEIDPRPFHARLQQVEGQLKREHALLDNATNELQRTRMLAAESLASTQEVDAQESLVAQYRASRLVSQGLVSAAELELGFTRITAPIAGRIGFRQVDAGNNVTPTDALAVIHVTDPIHVVFALPEDTVPVVVRELTKARQGGRSLEVEAWDKGNRSLLGRGQVITIDNQIDATTGTVKLKAQFGNALGSLFPNQFVNVKFVVDVAQKALVVPVAAIQRGRQQPFVYVVGSGDVIQVRNVTLGASDGERTIIQDGLNTGDVVVVQGADHVREGVHVKASNQTSEPASAAVSTAAPGSAPPSASAVSAHGP